MILSTPWLPHSLPPRLLYVPPPACNPLSGIATIYSAQDECAITITTAIRGVGVTSFDCTYGVKS